MRRAQSQYAAFQNKARQDFNEFRSKANADYAQFMERAWQEMSAMKGEEPPARPKPVRQPVAVPDRMPPTQPVPLPTPEVVPVPDRMPPPQVDPDSVVDELPAPAPDAPTVETSFYGSRCMLHADAARRLSLAAVSEKSAAQAWRQMSDGRYDALLRDCLALRGSMMLSDWGYLQLAHSAAVAAMGREGNEATLLQGWLLSQSGMDIRMAMDRGRYVLMVAFNEKMYRYTYINIEGQRFYLLDDRKEGSVKVCNMAFPKSQRATLALRQMPKLGMQRATPRTFEAQRFATMKATLSVNQRLMQFFDDYPQTDSYNYYVGASLSDELKQQLYPMLRSQLDGKSKKKQVQMLLDFVQSSFDYKTDKEQFGRERSFFGDESFFHPYNDCEDRSILFSILVRELVGLDVVLLVLPKHMATAVCFDTEVAGDCYMVQGRRYTVCDPTYIGADVGMAMPDFKNVKARIVML